MIYEFSVFGIVDENFEDIISKEDNVFSKVEEAFKLVDFDVVDNKSILMDYRVRRVLR